MMIQTCAQDINQTTLMNLLSSKKYHHYKAFNDLDKPVLFVGIAKSGTTSLTYFFRQLGIGCVHWSNDDNSFCEDHKFIRSVEVENGIVWKPRATKFREFCLVGSAIQAALYFHKKPLTYVLSKHSTVITQMDYCTLESCVFPQIDTINMIMDAYPNAYFILTVRTIKDHVNSIMNWNNFPRKLQLSGMLNRFPGQKETHNTSEKVKIFVENAYRIVRRAFRKRPTYKTLELDVSRKDASTVLKKFLGMNTSAVIPFYNQNKQKLNPVAGV